MFPVGPGRILWFRQRPREVARDFLAIELPTGHVQLEMNHDSGWIDQHAIDPDRQPIIVVQHLSIRNHTTDDAFRWPEPLGRDPLLLGYGFRLFRLRKNKRVEEAHLGMVTRPLLATPSSFCASPTR